MANSANAKNFPINTSSTTSATFQVDSANSGPKIKNNAGIMEVRDSADSVYAQLKQLQSGCNVYVTDPGAGEISITPADAYQKITFDVETWDLNAEFASNKFTAKTPGYYEVILNVSCNVIASGKYVILNIYKNGAQLRAKYIKAAFANNLGCSMTDIVYLNGTTDYIEAYIRSNDATPAKYITPGSQTWFVVHKISC